PGKPAAAVLFLPLIAWTPPKPQPGELWLDVLDVGQALAVVVRTEKHTLVYDTGDWYSDRFNAGDAMIVPFLRASGVMRLDAMVVSHGDSDHAGGAPALRQAYPPEASWTSVPRELWDSARYCGRDVAWNWDGIGFRFLHPDRDGAWLGNDGSCVLRIDAPGGSVLLPGDVEAAAEGALVERAEELDADILVAPHHGSASSSTAAFVDAVTPDWVLYSAGYRNRWDFPDSSVLERWRPAGFARTDCGGGVHVKIGPEGGPSAPVAWRDRYRRFWHAGCDGTEKSGTMRGVVGPMTASRVGG
ncbi:MAG: ComEC/Rec2 family competence protein, partial [Halofilum sp. (in: g-proteobacteria)]